MSPEAKNRKNTPVFSGVLNYFPDAIREVAKVSFEGNEQHNPGTELHWDRSKSGDEKDALTRHLLDAGTIDTDGMRHSAKVAWRALAMLQKEIEKEAQEEWEEEIIAQSNEECGGELGAHPLCSTDYCPCREEEIEKLVKPNLSDYPESNTSDISWGPYTEEHEEELDRRMNIIGQNGNTGSHYHINHVDVTIDE